MIVEIKENKTNGEAMLVLFPESKFRRKEGMVRFYYPTDEMNMFMMSFPEEWWDMPYKEVTNPGNEIRDFDEYVKGLGGGIDDSKGIDNPIT